MTREFGENFCHGSSPSLKPGDQAAPGTPGTGEAVCRLCEGTGRLDARMCPECEGSGTIIQGIGGA